MPVKIQELIIQTKIKTDVQELGHNVHAGYVHKLELNRLEERLYRQCMDAMHSMLSELNER